MLTITDILNHDTKIEHTKLFLFETNIGILCPIQKL